jgi:hypothetical protein
MATPTYDLLASTTLATATSSVTFSSIDQSYGDLILVCEASGTSSVMIIGIQFNSDTGSNYSYVSMEGNGSATSSTSGTQTLIRHSDGIGSGAFGLATFSIFDYSVTDKHKSVLLRFNNAEDSTEAKAARWANTNAITSITALTTANQFAAASTFNLYGVAK